MIFRSVDQGKPLPPFMRRWFVNSSDLKDFEHAAVELDRRLKRGTASPRGEVTPWLHSSVMRAVQSPAQSPARPMTRAGVKWAVGLALILLALGGSWWLNHNLFDRDPVNPIGRTAESIPSPRSTLDLTHNLASATSTSLTTPLNLEMENLKKDIRETTGFLLAALPQI